MQRPNISLLPLIAVLAATAAWSFTTQASGTTQDDVPEMAECRAEIQPEEVTAGGEVALAVMFPSRTGEITEVRTEDGSGIVVLGFEPSEVDSDSLMAQLEVPDEAAGTWWLEFDAAGETCKALLTVKGSALGR